MIPEDELERRVQRWLADTARPMPRDLVDDVILELPARSRRPWLSRLPVPSIARPLRRGVAAAAVGVAVLALAIAGLRLPFLGQLPGGAGGSPSVPVTAGPSGTWDAGLDFRGGSTASNPSPDRYGNAAVWSYLFQRATPTPGDYQLMPSFDPATKRWQVPEFPTLTIGPGAAGAGLELHPYLTGNEGTVRAVLGWTSPTSGQITLGASFAVEGACPAPSSGVSVWISLNATPIWSADIRPAGSDAFESTVIVHTGDVLYVGVDPGINSNCDTTTLVLHLAGS